MTSSARWAKLVEEWQQSGESADVFAKRHKCKPGALTWWSARFDRDEAKRKALEKVEFIPVVGKAEDNDLACPAEAPRDPRDVPHLPEPQKAKPAQDFGVREACGLVIELGQLRVRVQRGFDTLLLKQVIEALGGC